MDPLRVDIAVIGGGFAGCATASVLAARGVRVVVLEREPELGRQASGRGAGLGRQLAEDDSTSAVVVRGAAILRERFPAAWSPTGGILTFDDATHAQAYISRAHRLAVAHEVIGRARVLALWPALTELPIVSALYVPGDGVIDVAALLAAYADGLDVRCGVEVVRISDAPGGMALVTAGGDAIHTRVVVDAAGAWSGQLSGDPPLESYKRHLYVLEAAPPAASTPYLWHLGRAELYLRPAAGATLASPCDADPTAAVDQQADPDADATLRARFAVAPELAAAPISRRWACQRAFTADRRMRVGRDPRRPWLVWAAALGGHGATASPVVGELAAAAALEALAALG